MTTGEEALQVLRRIAASGVVPKNEWRIKVKGIFRARMTECMDESNGRMGFTGRAPQQQYVKRREEVCALLDNYEHDAPFTVQRLAEVLLAPREKQYCATHKLCNAVEKLLSVSSIAPWSSSGAIVTTTATAAGTGVAATRALNGAPKSPSGAAAVAATTDGGAGGVEGLSPGGRALYVHSSTPTASSRKRHWDDAGSPGVAETKCSSSSADVGAAARAEPSVVGDDTWEGETEAAHVPACHTDHPTPDFHRNGSVDHSECNKKAKMGEYEHDHDHCGGNPVSARAQ
jgi:hypothetical protein